MNLENLKSLKFQPHCVLKLTKSERFFLQSLVYRRILIQNIWFSIWGPSVAFKFRFLYRAIVLVHFKVRFLCWAIVLVHFKVCFLYRPIVSVHFNVWFLNRLILSAKIILEVCIGRLCRPIHSKDRIGIRRSISRTFRPSMKATTILLVYTTTTISRLEQGTD